ncbi:hypothetical protein K437DRAFT_108121 [Tilletiaria anomala UBC 951]|uniref:Mid2 domain-containing protein n=1 Tax=Tilletiaria anomala (strain ATCC 24038 / CBS 436.72 / UBC 951) TaxID=1037660 RepID=A0A066W6U3_TILAU|nr:uncharacterized protein K437DRAFT_108121 [Tilletiaria anomala UBC 951]KDN46495.1 hypothetical protein K437DRAFT_108121 [Tilletiaria anomala UBC 951]
MRASRILTATLIAVAPATILADGLTALPGVHDSNQHATRGLSHSQPAQPIRRRRAAAVVAAAPGGDSGVFVKRLGVGFPGGNDSSTAAASASSSSSAASASSSSAAAASSSSAAASSSSAAAASSSSIAAQLSSNSAESASLASVAASLAAASASAASASSSSAFYATAQLAVTVISSTPTPTGNGDSSGSGSSGSHTGLIIGVSVAGGVALIALLAFLYFKFGNKRFSGYDYDENDIKWPELKADNDGTGAAMQPLPARRTGGAGFDMGDELSDDGLDGAAGVVGGSGPMSGGQHGEMDEKYAGRSSFTGSTTALSAAPPVGYPVNGVGYTPSGYDAQSSMAHTAYSSAPGGVVPGGYDQAGYSAGYANYATGAPGADYGHHGGVGYAGGYGAAPGYSGHDMGGGGQVSAALDPASGGGYIDPHYAHDLQSAHGFADPYGRITATPTGYDAYGNPRM